MNTHRIVAGRNEVRLPFPWPGMWLCGEPDPTQADGLCGYPLAAMATCPIHHPGGDS